jgi:hypothetical protein
MPSTVHRPLKIIAFNAKSTGKQAYKVRKQLHDLEMDIAVFSVTYLKPHLRFYIPNNCIYQTDREDGNKGRTAVAVKKVIPQTFTNLPPFCSAEAKEVCMLTGNLECCLQLFINPCKDYGVTQISQSYEFVDISLSWQVT